MKNRRKKVTAWIMIMYIIFGNITVDGMSTIKAYAWCGDSPDTSAIFNVCEYTDNITSNLGIDAEVHIKGENTAIIDQEKTLTAVVFAEIRGGDVIYQWGIDQSSAEIVEITGGKDTSSVQVKAKADGTATISLSVSKNGQAIGSAVHQMTVEKKSRTVGLDCFSVEDGQGWKTKITLTAAVNDYDPGEHVTFYSNDCEIGMVAINGGTAQIDWTPGSYGVYDLQAKVNESDNYKYRESSIVTYSPNKEEQIFTSEQLDTPDFTYGELKEVAEVTDDGTGAADPKYRVEFVGESNGELDYNPVSKIVILKPAKAGTVKFRIVKKADDNYNEKKGDTYTVTVHKKEVTLGSVQAEDKTYDGSRDVKVKAQLEGLISEDESIYGTEIKAVGTADDANAGENKGVNVTFDLASMADPKTGLALADKYTFVFNEKESQTIDQNTTVTISPAILTLSIPDATTEWQNKEDPTTYNYGDLTVIAQGFVNNEKPENLDGFILPDLTVDSTLLNGNQGVGTKIDNVIIADSSEGKCGNPTSNYVFDFVNYDKRGSLTLTAQSVTSYSDFVHVDNDASTKVYQNDTHTIYYGVSDNDNDLVTVVFVPNSTDYQIVECVDGGTAVDNKITLTAADFVGISVTLMLKLKSSDGKHETKEFPVSLYKDNVNPNAEISIGNSTKTWDNFTEAVNFGVFGTALEAKINVFDLGVDNNGSSGMKNWSYVVVNTKEDVQFTEVPKIEDDVKDLFGNYVFTSMEDSSNAVVPLGKTDKDSRQEDGNYIVFVLVTDQVGNSALYGSNGAIVDNIKIDSINISYNTATDNKPDYFKGNVNLGVTVTENTDSIYTGVGKVTYEVTAENGINYTAKTKNEGNENGIFIDLLAEDGKGLPYNTLADLKNNYSVYEDALDINIDDEKSSVIHVKITSCDFSGNEIDTTKSFVIDNKAPEISNALTSRASVANGKYYSENVTITTTIIERYLDIENDVVYHINGENHTLGELKANAGIFGLKDIRIRSEALDESKSTDESKTVITLEFDKEAEYTVGTTATDMSGNSATTADFYNFVVDKTDPVVHITYYSYGTGNEFSANGSSEANPVYLNMNYSSFKAVVTVEELNFSLGDSVAADFVLTAKDFSGSDILRDFVASQKMNAATASQWTGNGIVRTYGDQNQCFISSDANYSFAFDYTDLSGRKAQITADYITLDRVVPSGSITVSGIVNHVSASQTWSAFLNKITFGFFGKSPMNTTLTSGDITAGVACTQYLMTSELLTKSQLARRTDWKDYTSPLTLSPNNNIIVYEKVVDKAGNTEYYSTENVVVDNVDPEPVVTITPSSPAWGKGVYAASDRPGFDIAVTDPIVNNAYSGLKKITYKIVNGTTGVTETGTLAAFNNSNDHVQSWNGHLSIDPAKFYSNDVQVTVTASDWSTNETASKTKTLQIDNKAPIVSFSFDTSDALNSKYYKNTKTLTITVDERNFDASYTPMVTSSAGGGYSFSGWSGNGDIHTGTVTFSGDSDYSVIFDCYDVAGNKSNTETLAEFTVDKTLPTVSVSYNNNSVQNGKYYKDARTATITITEHNFRASDVKVTMTALLNGSAISTPSISGWSTSGDRHTATISYSKDGDFTFDIAYSDLAGNAMADYAQDSFTVDLTAPDVEITGVKNQSANKGTVAPVITLSDTNYTADGVTLSLTGANKGKINVDSMISKAASEKGQVITFRNFANNMDDIYTLTAKLKDRAGNETTKSITFSVNRNGSTYIISEDTQKLLDTGFTNSPKDIVIQEINVDTLEFIELTYSKDGQVITLKEGTDYTVKEAGGNGQWKTYTYAIKASCFEEEGEYSINIYSEDRAKNATTNHVKEKAIEFVVDKTAPSISIANLENRGRYRENVHEFTLSVKDNTLLSYVELYIDGELVHTYSGDELTVVDGVLTIPIDSKDAYQSIRIIAYDAAGNWTDPIEYEVLVTSNWWVQFFMNKPLFWGCMAAGAVIAAGIGLKMR